MSPDLISAYLQETDLISAAKSFKETGGVSRIYAVRNFAGVNRFSENHSGAFRPASIGFKAISEAQRYI